MTAPDARKQYEDLGEKIFGNNLRTLWRPLSYLQNRYSHNAAQEAFQQVTVEHDKGLDEVHGFVNAPFNRMDYGVCKTYVERSGTKYILTFWIGLLRL
jgi:hypothetical protein